MKSSVAATLHVLVVEDDWDTAESTALVLRAYGHDVQIALSGPAALQAMEAEVPDVIFLDLAMPGMDGLELARTIRQRKYEKPPFLVAVTGLGRDEDYRHSLEAGIDLHLVKPADLSIVQDFLVRFQRVIG